MPSRIYRAKTAARTADKIAADNVNPNADFFGKTALITGGAKRIGAAIATDLSKHGATVLIHYHRDRRAAETLAARLNFASRSAFCLQSDLRKENSAADIFRQAGKILGKNRPLDFLINNAATYPENVLADVSADDFAETQKVIFFAPLACSRLFAAQAKNGAAIVNILDARICGYDRAHLAYHFAKRQLCDFTRVAAEEFAPKIRVNAVAPGLILAPKNLSETDAKKWLRARHKSNPLNAHGTPEQIADATRFLLQAEFITGEILFVDGGRNLRSQFYH